MVVFTCSRCGDSVKKPQVEKHLASRRCWGAVFCCIDCVKDFPGEEYKTHNSCITENERYGGKNFVPSVNKGQQKQQIWFEKVMTALDKAKSKQPPWLQRHFERLQNYPNIPFKKAKFESFVKNSLGIYDGKIATQIWDIIDQNIEKPVPPTNQQNGKCNSVQTNNSEVKPNGFQEVVADKDAAPSEPAVSEKKLNKREKKEERRKQAQKKEKKNKNTECVNDDATEQCEKKKKKKKQKDNEDVENRIGKKRKHEEIVDEADENKEPVNGESEQEDRESNEEEEEPEKKRFKTKFDWAGVIVEVLEGKDKEIKIKKLRKKVLAEYLAQGCTEKSEEKLWAKFNNKLKKNPLVKIQNDRVKLKN